MVSQVGAMADGGGPILDDPVPGAGHDVLLWGIAAFALGMLCAWIGTFAWLAVTFLMT